MNIEKDTVVTLHYEMFDANNQLIDKTEEPIAYLHGGYDGIFPLVEEALHGKAVGEEVDVTLSPDDAFGEQDPELVRLEPLNVFPVEVEVGMMFEADDPETGDTLVYRVTDIADGKAVVDGNHPLAGMKLRFKGNFSFAETSLKLRFQVAFCSILSRNNHNLFFKQQIARYAPTMDYHISLTYHPASKNIVSAIAAYK